MPRKKASSVQLHAPAPEALTEGLEPPAPDAPPAPESRKESVSSRKDVRSLARVLLRDSIEAYECFTGYRSEAGAAGDVAPSDELRGTFRALGDVASDLAHFSRTAIVKTLILLSGATDDFEEFGRPYRLVWHPCGATVGERFVFIEPGVGPDGRPDFDVDAAKVTIFDLADVEDLERSLKYED